MSYTRSGWVLKVLWILLSLFLTLPYPFVSTTLWVRLSLFEGDENVNSLDYLVPFVGNLRRTLVWSNLHQQNGSVSRMFVKREPVGRMLPWIHIYNIDQWWERNCDVFIWKEAELRRRSVNLQKHRPYRFPFNVGPDKKTILLAQVWSD